MWTRVKNRDEMHRRITVFDIEKDLASDNSLKAVQRMSTRKLGEVLFDPDEWKGKGDDLTIEYHKLSSGQLLNYAKLATKVR